MRKVGDWFAPTVAVGVEKLLAAIVEIEDVLNVGKGDVAGVEGELCDGEDLVFEIAEG